MSYLDSITIPTLLLDENKCRKNMQSMADKAMRNHTRLTPHFKTHQSRLIGDWFQGIGIGEINVSSIKMASYFSEQNWQNIHIAFPFNPLEAHHLDELAHQSSVSIQLVNEEVTKSLAQQLKIPVGFFIEIDAGYGRTGVEAWDYEKIEKILQAARPTNKLYFKGFYIHAGHTYQADIAGISKIHEETKNALKKLRSKFKEDFPTMVTRSGDTPSCALMENFEGIDEISPGNFIFYDLMQTAIGSCHKEDIAVALAVPIVDIKEEKNEILVHGGAIHLSKEYLMNADGSKNYGEVVLLNENGWNLSEETSYLKSISQEHGLIQASTGLVNQLKVGDLIGILPVHSCLTADCMGEFWSTEGQIIDHLSGQKRQLPT
ncbi:alanine racemase [Echinicola jeungdonensis]|uniref:Alanine racemase n=1 Tax=Echinicola jeungdonensis TaxID=709343 RepID=A0ABV5JAV8_9BACT|nr:alanine racemase [Echinicola jeungdonensis]MDN3670225.1 alanine racemase [Echinicola jeungdonensis]